MENVSKISADFESQISGAISIGATSFTLQSVKDKEGNDLSDGVYTFTIDRDNTSRKEYLIGQLTSATKTVSSISSVSSQGVLTANAQKAHRIGANVIISDHSILAALSRIFNGVGTINPASPLAYASNPTLSSAGQLATKGYVDSVVTGGSVNTDRIILGGQTAGETIAAGDIVYFKSSDSRWWKASATDTTTFSNVLIGVALGAGTAGNPVTDGVQIYGICDVFTGLTATATYYLSNTAGEIATSAGDSSVIMGQAFSSIGLFFNKDISPKAFINESEIPTPQSNAEGFGVKLESDGKIGGEFLNSFVQNVYTSNDTWTKPDKLKYVIVECIGGGGGAGGSYRSSSSSFTGFSGTGGGGGGYSKKKILASALASTVAVTVGTGGSGGSGSGGASGGGGAGVGGNGGTSSFGSHCSATGGIGGNSQAREAGVGGTGIDGDINLNGGGGSFGNPRLDGVAQAGGFGGGTIMAMNTPTTSANVNGPNGNLYGGGGGGGGMLATIGTGTGPNGGSGASGVVIVTEYYN